jgi:hypothetical protein
MLHLKEIVHISEFDFLAGSWHRTGQHKLSATPSQMHLAFLACDRLKGFNKASETGLPHTYMAIRVALLLLATTLAVLPAKARSLEQQKSPSSARVGVWDVENFPLFFYSENGTYLGQHTSPGIRCCPKYTNNAS